ncbi:hypothetical protein [Methylobrevis pamukkalensis]|uniref:Tat pathway signal sequence domain protein n=1 Tax=Methylobrevis pamukkalensis TaxID=1439726 RepID=A0A1E3H3G7_9HYPH|nr:hypothetical protein [Methylobrevis pamukkalensis]ODN70834.1 hypothetical protein A6302_01820 [Methylobrevis pamukkalensis]
MTVIRKSLRPSVRRLSPARAMIAAAAVCALASPALSQTAEADAPITVELNKLAPNGESCQATIVVRNGGGPLSSLKTDLVMFAPDGIVARRIAVELGPLARNKTFVKAFDIPGTGCDRIGRILLNDVIACADADGAALACLDRVEPTSLSAVTFDK